jgi:hypothetical protein
MKLNRSTFLSRFFATALLAVLFAVSACAAGSNQPYHTFSFGGWFDKWATEVDLLEYSYGDQYHMVRDKVRPERQSLGYVANVNAHMPVGEFLYVKWRIKTTGEVIEDKVDLRNRLANNMTDHALTFVIDGKQLYVYLVTPRVRNSKEPTSLKTYLSKYTVTYEIYPNNTYKP